MTDSDMLAFVYKWLDDAFDQPCNYSISGISIDEYMLDTNEAWCSEHCGKIESKDCWKRFLETLASSKTE